MAHKKLQKFWELKKGFLKNFGVVFWNIPNRDLSTKVSLNRGSDPRKLDKDI